MEEDQQQTPAEQPQTSPRLTHEKTIQPSQSLIDEMKTAQPPTPPQARQLSASVRSVYPEPTSGLSAPKQPAPQNNTQVPPSGEPQHLVVPPSSLYPEATAGIGAPPHAPSSPTEALGQEPEWKSSKSPTKVMAVRVVAGLIMLLNVINAYDWVLEKQAGYNNWLGALMICVMAVLAIGIFKLHEGARFIYVVVSVISLVLACVGLITFYVTTRQSPAAEASVYKSLTEAQLESNLKAVKADTHLPAKEKQVAIRETQKELNDLKDNTTELKVKQYLSTGLSVITAVGPLVFLTRPSIKRVFD